MRRRAAWAVGALALAAAALGLAWLWLPHRVASETAPRLLGERWYVVAFRHTPIGEYHTASGLTPGGHFEFTTALRFALAEGAELREDLRLVFDRGPPHRLREAQKVEQRGGAATRLVYRDGVATVTEVRIAVRLPGVWTSAWPIIWRWSIGWHPPMPCRGMFIPPDRWTSTACALRP